MKATLAYDRQKGQYRCDIGQPQRRFLLGSDPLEAAKRKDRLGTLWQNIRKRGGWTEQHVRIAKDLAAGRAVKIDSTNNPNPDSVERSTARKLAGIDTPVAPTARLEDFHAATIEMQDQKIAELEKLIRERLGPGAVALLDYPHRDSIHDERE